MSPAEDVYVADEIVLKLAASDDLVVESVTLHSANRSWQAAQDRSTGHWEAFLNTRNLQDGENDLQIEIRDVSGRTSVTTRRIMVDNSGPTITLLSRQLLSGRSEIAFRIEDRSAIATYQYRLDSGQWKELLVDRGKGTYKFVWTTDLKDNGEHRLDIRATDSLGNTGEAAFKVRVENQDYSWVIAVVLVVLAIALAAVFLYRRKTRAIPEETAAGPSLADSLPDIPARVASEKKTMLSETAEGERSADEIEQGRH